MRTRALVVDDHPAFRSAARRLLESAGMEVVGEAAGAVAAVEAAQALHPDLVLLDVRLPDGNGFDVARTLQECRAATVTVLTSSRTDPDFDLQARAAGAAGFLPKSELSSAALSALLDGGSAR